MPSLQPFHLAIASHDLNLTKDFYVGILGLTAGRENTKWIDWNFFGHQVTTHLAPNETSLAQTNPVDGHQVPCKHFGVIMEWQQWKEFSNKIKDKVKFIIEPCIRFKGQTGEQATMFFLDPSNNALEFKAFKNEDELFKNFE